MGFSVEQKGFSGLARSFASELRRADRRRVVGAFEVCGVLGVREIREGNWWRLDCFLGD